MKRYEIVLFDGGNIVADRKDMNVVDFSYVELNHDETIGSAWTSLIMRNGMKHDKYCRYIMAEDGSTRVDFGSYSYFVYIKEIA